MSTQTTVQQLLPLPNTPPSKLRKHAGKSLRYVVQWAEFVPGATFENDGQSYAEPRNSTHYTRCDARRAASLKAKTSAENFALVIPQTWEIDMFGKGCWVIDHEGTEEISA